MIFMFLIVSYQIFKFYTISLHYLLESEKKMTFASIFLLLRFLSDSDTLHLGKSYSSTEIQHMHGPFFPRSLPYPNKQSPPRCPQSKTVTNSGNCTYSAWSDCKLLHDDCISHFPTLTHLSTTAHLHSEQCSINNLTSGTMNLGLSTSAN